MPSASRQSRVGGNHFARRKTIDSGLLAQFREVLLWILVELLHTWLAAELYVEATVMVKVGIAVRTYHLAETTQVLSCEFLEQDQQAVKYR